MLLLCVERTIYITAGRRVQSHTHESHTPEPTGFRTIFARNSTSSLPEHSPRYERYPHSRYTMVRSKQLVAIVAAIVAAAAVVRAAPAPEKYTTKYDNVDVDGILNNDRLFNSYFKCLMDEGKCTPEGEEIKREFVDGT